MKKINIEEEQVLEERIKTDPGDSDAYIQLGSILYRKIVQTNNDELINKTYNFFKNAIEKSSGNDKLKAYYAGTLFIKAKISFLPNVKLKYLNLAIDIIDNLIKEKPNFLTARRIRAFSSIQMPVYMGRLNMAIEDFEYLIDYEANNPGSIDRDILCDFYMDLGNAYQIKERKDDAKSCWLRIKELIPNTEMAKKAQSLINNLNC